MALNNEGMAYHMLGKIRNTKKIAKYIVDDLKNSIISNLEITLKTFKSAGVDLQNFNFGKY